MVIISAGVVMNLILGCVCFMVAYSHGVEEKPAIVGAVAVGSPAWEKDLRAGDQIVLIDDIKRPTFDDIRPTVMSASKDEAIRFRIRGVNGAERDASLVPRRNPEDLYPLVGINPAEQLVLQKSRRPDAPPVKRESPAAKATTADGSHFRGGDRVVAATDPDNPDVVSEIAKDPRDPSGAKLDTFDFLRRQHRLRGKPMTVRIDRDGAEHDFVVEPAAHQVFPGIRFQMGRLAAIRADGPAARAALVGPAGQRGLMTGRPDQLESADKIIAVEFKDGDKVRRLVESVEKEGDVVFDPLRLGYELEKWAETAADRNVRITVLRTDTKSTTNVRVTFDMKWDPELVYSGEAILGASSPMPISGLGLAYYVDATIDAAPGNAGGLSKGDIITEVRFRDVSDKGEVTTGDWLPIKQYQGASLIAFLQRTTSPNVDFKVTRAGDD